MIIHVRGITDFSGTAYVQRLLGIGESVFGICDRGDYLEPPTAKAQLAHLGNYPNSIYLRTNLVDGVAKATSLTKSSVAACDEPVAHVVAPYSI